MMLSILFIITENNGGNQALIQGSTLLQGYMDSNNQYSNLLRHPVACSLQVLKHCPNIFEMRLK